MVTERTLGFSPDMDQTGWEAFAMMLQDCGVKDPETLSDIAAILENHIEATKADGTATITHYKPQNWHTMHSVQAGDVEIFFISDTDLQIVIFNWTGG